MTIRKRIGSIYIVESAYAMGTRLPPHAHQEDHLTLVMQGEYVEELASGRFTRQPEDVLYLPRDVAHGEIHLTHGKHLMIDPPRTSLERLRLRRERLQAPRVLPPEASAVAMVLHKRFLNRDWVSPVYTEVLLVDLLLHCRPARAARRRPPQFLQHAINIVTRYFGGRLKIASIARQVGVSPRRLARSFKRWYGASLRQLLLECRLQFAFRELRRDAYEIGDIAVMAGLYDQSHLGKVFHRAFSISPDAFRRTRDLATDLDPIARQKCIQFLLSGENPQS